MRLNSCFKEWNLNDTNLHRWVSKYKHEAKYTPEMCDQKKVEKLDSWI